MRKRGAPIGADQLAKDAQAALQVECASEGEPEEEVGACGSASLIPVPKNALPLAGARGSVSFIPVPKNALPPFSSCLRSAPPRNAGREELATTVWNRGKRND